MSLIYLSMPLASPASMLMPAEKYYSVSFQILLLNCSHFLHSQCSRYYVGNYDSRSHWLVSKQGKDVARECVKKCSRATGSRLGPLETNKHLLAVMSEYVGLVHRRLAFNQQSWSWESCDYSPISVPIGPVQVTYRLYMLTVSYCGDDSQYW